jgi:hypothetical protein
MHREMWFNAQGVGAHLATARLSHSLTYAELVVKFFEENPMRK